MGRILFLLLLGLGLVLWWKSRASQAVRRSQPPGQAPGAADPAASPQAPAPASPAAEMVACPVCGVHFPKAEGVDDASGRVCCSPAHAASGAPRAGEPPRH